MRHTFTKEEEQAIQQARDFWADVAVKSGKWSMDGRGVQVWIDKDGKTLDSIYAPEGTKKDCIIRVDNVGYCDGCDGSGSTCRKCIDTEATSYTVIAERKVQKKG